MAARARGGLWLAGFAAFAVIALAGAVFGLGECLHGAVQAPLVADLADHRLLGRYMAMSAFSWQVGFTIGPPVGGLLLSVSPTGLWIFSAAVCLAAGAGALVLERSLPTGVRRSPLSPRPDPAAPGPVAAPARAR